MSNTLKQFIDLLLCLFKHEPYRIPIYITNRCNSHCLICNIWKLKPKIDIDPYIIQKLLSDKKTKKTRFTLVGGEPILHPKYKEILSLFENKDYRLCSNGILVDKLIESVREFKIKNLSLSLDGRPQTQKKVRGVDNYDCIIKILNELKNDDVEITIEYTISPWNSRKDLLHVINLCKKYGIKLGIGYYNKIEFFQTTEIPRLPYVVKDILPSPYFYLYELWLSGNLKLPCYSILIRPVIRPNGDVQLCDPINIKLGNLCEEDFSQIWDSTITHKLQKKYRNCNRCWLNCQRPFDIILSTFLKTIAPTFVLNRIIGPYEWNKIPRFSLQIIKNPFFSIDLSCN